MASIKQGALVCICALVLASCQSLPGIGGNQSSKGQKGAGLELTDNFVAMPDPYRQSAPPLPPELVRAFTAAQQLMAAEQYADAERSFAAIASQRPRPSGPWVNIGIARWRQSQTDTAAEAFERALSLNKLNGDAYTQWGVMARELGDFSTAEMLYRDALAVWPHNYDAHINLGVLLDLYRGELKAALEHYKMAAQIAGEPSRQLQGWVIDLERSMAQQ